MRTGLDMDAAVLAPSSQSPGPYVEVSLDRTMTATQFPPTESETTIARLSSIEDPGPVGRSSAGIGLA